VKTFGTRLIGSIFPFSFTGPLECNFLLIIFHNHKGMENICKMRTIQVKRKMTFLLQKKQGVMSHRGLAILH
jgi:hypothetical protein